MTTTMKLDPITPVYLGQIAAKLKVHVSTARSYVRHPDIAKQWPVVLPGPGGSHREGFVLAPVGRESELFAQLEQLRAKNLKKRGENGKAALAKRRAKAPAPGTPAPSDYAAMVVALTEVRREIRDLHEDVRAIRSALL